MAITLRRQLNPDEKAIIVERHGRVCFATGHSIPEGELIQFDHIRAYSDGGATELYNIAPMCEHHNKQKGALPLEDYRVKLRLEEFFRMGDTLTLKHLLEYLRGSQEIPTFGEPVSITINDEWVELQGYDGKRNKYALYKCPTTGWQYFYATLPINLLNSDDDEDDKIGLQPRYLIIDKVFELYRHFQRHPVLQPSVGRIHNNRILLFDGQHKAAALLWTGRREFECKIYLSPDLRLLNQTNISAHDKFAQTRFYASVMVLKLGTQFGLDFERYKNLEDGIAKSEAGFMAYLERDPEQTLTRAERNARFRSYLYNSILDHSENKASQFVSKANRGTAETPLTIDLVSKSLFASFLYTEPVEDNLASDAYKRDKEIENNVALMNMLYDIALSGWNSKAGPLDAAQRKLARIFRSKSIMAWSDILKGAVCGKLDLNDGDDRARPFYRDLSDESVAKVRRVVENLVSWPRWAAPPNDPIDSVLNDSKEEVKKWLKDQGLTTGYLMGAVE